LGYTLTMIKISFGSGGVVLPDWIHVDLDPACRPDVIADATRPLPFATATADFLHSEDFVDQLDLDASQRFLHECRRVLKPGGQMRLLTVDLRRLVDMYVEGDERLLELWETGVGLPLQTRTLGEVLNEGMRRCGHRFVHDEQTLRVLLNRAGFHARRVDFNHSEHPELRDLDLRSPAAALSMYFECWPTSS